MDVVNELLSSNDIVNARDNEGNTPLQLAIAHDSSAGVIQALVNHKATIVGHRRNSDHASVLMTVILRGIQGRATGQHTGSKLFLRLRSMLEYLLKHAPTDLLRFEREGEIENTGTAAEGDNGDVLHNQLLLAAVRLNDEPIVRTLLESHPYFATRVNALSKGVCVEHTYSWNFSCSFVSGIKKGFLHLVWIGPSGETPLHIAVQLRNDDIVSLLLRFGARPDVTDRNGDTPLQLAIDQRFVAKSITIPRRLMVMLSRY